jgi:hypothetical protein
MGPGMQRGVQFGEQDPGRTAPPLPLTPVVVQYMDTGSRQDIGHSSSINFVPMRTLVDAYTGHLSISPVSRLWSSQTHSRIALKHIE